MAMAASTAFPPRRSTSAPVALASTWSEVTAPWVPITSGRRLGGWAATAREASGCSAMLHSAMVIAARRASDCVVFWENPRPLARRVATREAGELVMPENLPSRNARAIRGDGAGV